MKNQRDFFGLGFGLGQEIAETFDDAAGKIGRGGRNFMEYQATPFRVLED
jgi:hypothetical protein